MRERISQERSPILSLVLQVQIIPWMLGDSNYLPRPMQWLDPRKTIFVGALHGMLNAEGLATIFDDLFGGEEILSGTLTVTSFTRCGVCRNRHGQAQVPNWQREGRFWQSSLLHEGCGRCICRDQMSEVLQESAGQSPGPKSDWKNFSSRWILTWRMRSAHRVSSDKDLTFAGFLLHFFSGFHAAP